MTGFSAVFLALLAAEQWREVGRSAEQNQIVWFDQESVRRSGDVVDVTVRYTYPEPRYPHTTSSIYTMQFSCTEPWARMMKYVDYDEDRVVRESQYRPDDQSMPYRPNSPYQWVVQEVCR